MARQLSCAHMLGAVLLLGFQLGASAQAVLAAARAAPVQYEVGPGREFASIAAVGQPLAALGPGNELVVHWREAHYHEKLVLSGAGGTAAAPVVMRGVPDPVSGALPVLNAIGATTPPVLNYPNEARSLLQVGGANVPAGIPQYLLRSMRVASVWWVGAWSGDGGGRGGVGGGGSTICCPEQVRDNRLFAASECAPSIRLSAMERTASDLRGSRRVRLSLSLSLSLARARARARHARSLVLAL